MDYDIVYVRAPRYGDDRPTRWPEIAHPAGIEPGADLMLLHPDGSEEVLVGAGSRSVTDPYVSFDGRSVFYSLIEQSRSPRLRGPARLRADIYKIDVRTRRIVRLTQQTDDLNVPGVLNLGPCPVPGGRIAFVSNRNDFHSPKSRSSSLQLFVMDEDGSNVELIGAFNLGSALHPSILANGRLLFSTRESQGLRNGIMWGIWSLNPDGTNWAPAFSAFDAGHAFHFQTELSDGSVVIEEYYNQNNNGFGAYLRVPASRADEPYRFGPADKNNPRNPRLRFGRFMSGQPKIARFAFSPPGVESLTPFASNVEGAADLSRLDDPTSIRVGKVTHPSGAPDNHLLTVWSPGPVNQQGGLKLPAVDGGIYLIRAGSDVEEPADMLLIKNSPEFNEQFPRALVPYSRIYGVASPRLIRPLANDGR
ncbi:MAG: TolB family protein, partial [Dehalococcoidia bacterium]